MTIILSGDNGVTFPNSTVQASSGVVLQVVQGTLASTTSTTSTSYVTSGLTASITPKFATSKVLVMVNGGKTYASNDKIIGNMYRNGTTLGASASWVSIEVNFVGGVASNHSFCYLDSPATVSSTTYTAYFKSSGGSAVYFSDTPTNTGQVTITLMEIAA